MAVFSGFARVLLSTPAAFYGAFGIAWVLAWMRWGLVRFPRAIEDVRVCFADEKQFLEIADRTIDRLSSRAWAFCLSAVLLCFGLTAVILGLFVFVHDPSRSRLLPPAWYQGSRVMHLAILIVLGVSSSLPSGTGLWLLARNALFLNEIRDLTVVPFPGIILARFRPLTAYYLWIAGSWFLGVTLMAVIFVGHLNPLPLFLLSLFSLAGIVTAFVPQLIFHAYITHAASEVAGEFVRIYKVDFSSRIDSASLQVVTSMLQATQPAQVWIINLKDIALVGAGSLLPMASVQFRNWLGFHV